MTAPRLSMFELATRQREMEWRERLEAAGYRVIETPWRYEPAPRERRPER